MSKQSMLRGALKKAKKGGAIAGLVGLVLLAPAAQAADPVKLGLMLPYSGAFANIGRAIENGLRLAIEQQGGKLGSREVKYVVLDAKANPAKAVSNMQRLVSGENVDFVIGPVSSGVALGMIKVARQENIILIIPLAGLNVATRQLCAPTIFRTVPSNWQPANAMGKAVADMDYETIVTITWDYSGGKETIAGFKDGFMQAGGKIIKEIYVPFPSMNFQTQLTQIANLKPDAVFAFFAGAGAVKFVRDYAKAGLKDDIQLLGTGYLTASNLLEAQGKAAEDVLTTMQYARTLDSPENQKFKAAYREKYGKPPNMYAVGGYDTGLLLAQAMDKVNGNTDNLQAFIKAMESLRVKSPGSDWHFSKAHSPIMDFYLREVRNGENVVVGVAAKNLKDPATGCQIE